MSEARSQRWPTCMSWFFVQICYRVPGWCPSCRNVKILIFDEMPDNRNLDFDILRQIFHLSGARYQGWFGGCGLYCRIRCSTMLSCCPLVRISKFVFLAKFGQFSDNIFTKFVGWDYVRNQISEMVYSYEVIFCTNVQQGPRMRPVLLECKNFDFWRNAG